MSAIVEAPAVKDGSVKELHHLCNIVSHHNVSQYFRVLRATKQEPSEPFIIFLIELKLDQTTDFEWQRHCQNNPNVPHFHELLKFLDLWAQALEAAIQKDQRRHPTNTSPTKACAEVRTEYVATVGASCTVCGAHKHAVHTARNSGHYQKSRVQPSQGTTRRVLIALSQATSGSSVSRIGSVRVVKGHTTPCCTSCPIPKLRPRRPQPAQGMWHKDARLPPWYLDPLPITPTCHMLVTL